ncbi:hypothetical protein [Limnofasciculus baicalensis]|uniref:Tetratricopeptide repeat protein n=1 Tax=Limnofasciculus baicalensis BBK-W-15 TaxID=2699891 RepID=A0AAE3GW44_9CYAN|nr:hypothetical protein [Limnofasciculus baicalensis]MCP2729652.1 hypothetical protein [Limnofasciculus baicalensis BBK-W-15]
MADTREDAYLELIQNLLNSPHGEESAILNVNSDLVDGGLVQMMLEKADNLRWEGSLDNANRLMNIAGYLLGVYRKIDSLVAATQAEYFNLLIELLQATSDSKGNPEVVYPLLEANQDKLNLSFAEVLSNWARVNLPQQEATVAAGNAGVIVDFSNLIWQFPLGRRRDNLEIAIVGYEIALSVFTQAAFPEHWAGTQHNLGNAYSERIKGEKTDNLEMEIACYGEALKIRTLTQRNCQVRHSQRNAPRDLPPSVTSVTSVTPSAAPF